jgi:ABC-type glycerol-3-phosphate transport system substrate-binding protein
MARAGIMALAFLLAFPFTSWAGGQTESARAATPLQGRTLIESLNPDFKFPADPVKLVMWDFWEGERPLRVQYERKLATEYQALHPNVSISIVGIPSSGFQTKYRTALASGTGPDIGVVGIGDLVDWGWNKQKDQPQYGYPVPDWLLPHMKKVLRPGALLEGSIESPQTGKRVYLGVIAQADGGLYLYYNRTFFDEAGLQGPPETTREMVDYARKLSKYTPQGDLSRQGFAIRFRGGWNVAYKAYPFLWAFTDGTRDFLFTDDYLDTRIDNPLTVSAIESYQSFVTTLKISSPLLPEADESMLSGLGAMSFRESFFWGLVTQKAPQFKFGVAPAPNGESPYGTHKVGTDFGPHEVMIPLVTDPRKVDVAYDFAAYIQLVPEHDLEMSRVQGIVPLMTANLSSEYAINLPMAKAMALVETRPMMNVALSPYGVTNEARTILGKAMETIVGQAANVNDAIKAAAAQVRSAIKSGVEASKAR